MRILTRGGYTVQLQTAVATDFAAHFHAAFTVATILDGDLELSTAGRSLAFTAGATALLNAGQLHSAHADRCTFLSVRLMPAMLDELMSQAQLSFWGAMASFHDIVVADAAIAALAGKIQDEVQHALPAQGFMLNALVNQLSVHLVRNHVIGRRDPKLELSRAGLLDRRIRLAVELMHDNYGRELSLEEVAGAAFLSPYHFARLFKQITGQTTGEYLTNLRVERARQLLLDTRLQIGQIAGDVGYRSQSHFARVFRAITGLSPAAYRAAGARADDEAFRD